MIMEEVMEDEHLWTGDTANIKWLTLNLDEDTDSIKFKDEASGKVANLAIQGISVDGKPFYRCTHCGAVWDRTAYPAVHKIPFEHIRCPSCDCIVAESHPIKNLEEVE